MVRDIGSWTRTQATRCLARALAVVAVTGLLCGCVPGSAPPAPGSAPASVASGDDLATTSADSGRRDVAPTEFSTVTGADVAEAESRLTSMGVTPAELAEACTHYAESGWSHAEAWDAAMSAGRPRIGEVVADVNAVAEEIALPGEWVRSITGSVDRSPALWTEAERDAFVRAVAVRKSKLIEPLCAR